MSYKHSQVRTMTIRLRGISLMLFLAGGLCSFPFRVEAQNIGDYGDGGSAGNWELMVGGIAWCESTYTGSDEVRFMPLPLIMASFNTRYLKLFLEGDEAGAELKFGAHVPLTLAFGIGLGEDRSEDDSDIPDGAPAIENSMKFFGTMTVKLPWEAKLSARARYFPITAVYDEPSRAEQDFSGMLFDLAVEREWLLYPFLFQIESACAWMNNDYAEAYFGIAHPSAERDTFEADAGLHDVRVSVLAMMFFNARSGIGAMAEGKYLLGEAAESPLTKSTMQPSFGLLAWYRF